MYVRRAGGGGRRLNLDTPLSTCDRRGQIFYIALRQYIFSYLHGEFCLASRLHTEQAVYLDRVLFFGLCNYNVVCMHEFDC